MSLDWALHAASTSLRSRRSDAPVEGYCDPVFRLVAETFSNNFADPTAKVGFGYVMNQMGKGWQNARNRGLMDSLYDCL
jgi:hypothetical protein